jgi:hypothetical protein
MLRMGGFTRILVNKYGFDDAGYRFVVVPVRDRMSAWATRISNDVIDGAVAGVGTATMRMARTTYTAVDQRIIDGGVNGAAFSAAWWSATTAPHPVGRRAAVRGSARGGGHHPRPGVRRGPIRRGRWTRTPQAGC